MEWGEKTIVNLVKRKFLNNDKGLDTEAIRKLFPDISFDDEISTTSFSLYNDDKLNVIFIPYQLSYQRQSFLAHLYDWENPSRNTEILDDLEARNSIALIYDPECKRFKYYGYYSSDDTLIDVDIDWTKPSDIQIAKGFISHYEKMVEEESPDSWNWWLKHFRIDYTFNGESFKAEVTDETLRRIFTEDSFFANRALNRLFRKALKPFPFFKKNEDKTATLYFRFYMQENDDYLYAEVANDNILALNNKLFIKYDDNGEPDGRSGHFITEAPRLYSKNNALDYIYKPYLYCAFFDKTNIPQKSIHKIQQNKEEVFSLTISIDEQEVPDDNTDVIVFSSSPQEEQKIYVTWKSLALRLGLNKQKQFANCFVPKPNLSPKINKRFQSIFSSGIQLWIYRVGQANFIAGYSGKTNNSFVFDCGMPTPKNKKLAKDGIDVNRDDVDFSFIYNIKPQLIIISHWDYDHYSGMYSFSRSVWNNKDLLVVAPSEGISEMSDWAKTVLCYLVSKGALYLLEAAKSHADDPIFALKGKGVLFQGKGSDKNNKSLLLRLRKTILTGDCSDKNWPKGFGDRSSIKELVIPHHGASAVIEKSDIASSIIKDKKKYNIYICAGYNNKYDHPRKDWLEPSGTDKSFCSIECTNIANPDADTNNRKPNPVKDPIIIKNA